MKSAFWRATALLMAFTFVLPAVALAGGQAGEVSHSAMMGSTLMNTSAQLNTWTHWATGYGDYTEINTQSLDTSGAFGPQATLIWDYDDANTLLFRVRDQDLGSQSTGFMFGSMASPLSSYTGISSYNALTRGQIVNIALARELTNGAFSIGGFVASNGTKDNGSTPNTERGSSAFGGQFTWGNGNGLDVSVSVAKGSTTDDNGTNDLSDDALMFDAYGRYTHNDWIYQFGGFIGSGSDEFVGGSGIETDDFTNLGLLLNVGQMLKDDSDGQVSVEFYGMFLTNKDEPQGGGEMKNTDIFFPGMRSACSLKVSDHFGILLGADGYYGLNGYTDDTGTPAATTDIDMTGFNFDWSGGIFWENEAGFRVSGEFVQSNLDQAFSLGNDQPLVSRLEATFGF